MIEKRFRGWGRLVGLMLALSLTVVLPIRLHRPLLPTCNPGTGLRAAHHAVIDRAGTRVAVHIDRFRRAPGPDLEARASSSPTARRPLNQWMAVVRFVPTPRHLRIAPGARAEDPFGPMESTVV